MFCAMYDIKQSQERQRGKRICSIISNNLADKQLIIESQVGITYYIQESIKKFNIIIRIILLVNASGREPNKIIFFQSEI